MKKGGIYNAELSEAVGRMGHGDIILIGDVGCPFPRHTMTTTVDLAVSDGIPKVSDVLKAVIEELVVEAYIVAQETKDVSPATYDVLKNIMSGVENKDLQIKEKVIQHAQMKDMWLNGALRGEEVKVFVRTGERTPFCYIALVAGVDF